jgi:hypothetical protein
MRLAILLAGVEAQEHLLGASVSWPGSDVEEAGSPLAGFGKRGAYRAGSCATPTAKKSQNRLASMKFGLTEKINSLVAEQKKQKSKKSKK